MAVGDIITAARYNAVQNRISVIMGQGAGSTGYGQPLASSQRPIGSTITLLDYLNVRTDMLKARQHQTGSDESSTIPLRTTSNEITEVDAANLEARISTIEADKFVIGSGQSTTATAITSQRTTSWNGRLTHAITIDFGSANQARYFFNSGGKIRTRATLTGGTPGSIFTDWVNMLTNMGIISIDYTETVASGTGTGSNIGFYDLTTSNQQLFTKVGSGAYAANDYTVLARCDVANNANGGARYIYLTIQFNDDKGPNPGIDENVTGTLTSFVETLTATGSNVNVTPPTFINTTIL